MDSYFIKWIIIHYLIEWVIWCPTVLGSSGYPLIWVFIQAVI